jgi:hypothetical protein
MRYPRSERTTRKELIEMLEAVPPASDAQVCYVYDRLLVSLSADGAAQGFFAGAARVCIVRPHLAERVLREPINCLVCLGIETSRQVFDFLQEYTRGVWFEKEAGTDGIKWLLNEVPKMEPLLTRLLAEELEKNIAASDAILRIAPTE